MLFEKNDCYGMLNINGYDYNQIFINKPNQIHCQKWWPEWIWDTNNATKNLKMIENIDWHCFIHNH